MLLGHRDWGPHGILALILMVVALVDCVQRRFADSTTKVLWAMLIVMLPLIGPLLYLCIGRDQGEKSEKS